VIALLRLQGTMASLVEYGTSSFRSPGYCSKDSERSRAEKRKVKNREKQRRFRARTIERLSHFHGSNSADESLLLDSARTGKNKNLESYDRHTQRITAEAARKIALYALTALKDFEPALQNLVLEKTVGHTLLQSFLPDYLKDLQAVKQNQVVVGNINSGMASHLIGVRPSHSLMAKDIVCTLASSHSVGSSRGLAKVLGIKKAIMRKVLLDTQSEFFWTCYKRATKSDILPKSVRMLVIKWWTTQSTISPERKRVLQKRIAVRSFESHPTHFIQVSQVRVIFPVGGSLFPIPLRQCELMWKFWFQDHPCALLGNK
jgi:hypothetical protein